MFSNLMTYQPSPQDLEAQLLMETCESLSSTQKRSVDKEVLDICYSRSMCSKLGVNYKELGERDMLMVYRHVMEKLGYLSPT